MHFPFFLFASQKVPTLTNFKVVKCGRMCVVCDQPKSARTHAHRTHISKVFSHAHAHVRPHIAHVRARTHLRNPCLEYLFHICLTTSLDASQLYFDAIAKVICNK